jgi:phosphoribosylformylglycinamidine cyclo-ligase
VEKLKIPDKNLVQNGDVVIGLASSGVHSNGFSLIRKIFNIDNDKRILEKYYPELNKTLGEELLTPTKIYVKPILELLKKINVRSLCHITGGGFYENLPRAFGENCGAIIKKSAIEIPPVFNIMAVEGKIPERDMFNTYNMGIGMCVIIPEKEADESLIVLRSCGEKAVILGEIKDGISGVEIK